MTARARTVCDPCRTHHLKCDQITPVCGRCKASDRPCTRHPAFRGYKKSFPNKQKWIGTPSVLNFVHETQILDYGSESDDDNPSTNIPHEYTPISPSSSHHPQNEASPIPTDSHTPISTTARTTSLPPGAALAWDEPSTLAYEPHHHVSLPRMPGLPHHDFNQLPSPVSSTPRAILNHDTSPIYQDDQTTFQDTTSTSISTPSIYLSKTIWPLKDPQEARLLRHYVDNLAIWLDLCDPLQHFQVEVPLRAGACPILLNAIFALAARHLNLTGEYDAFASNRYHEECLKYLIPLLNISTTISDETLFAATIILRVLEEIDLKQDLQSHIVGIQVFVNALFRHQPPLTLTPSLPSNTLATAAFWIGLRQEIYMAIMSHRSLQISLGHCYVDRSTRPASDFVWANRAIVLCADVLNCCFGTEGVSVVRWKELKGDCERWDERKPDSFTPTFYEEFGGGDEERHGERRRSFPNVQYMHGCHVIAVQHQMLALMLLCIFDPTIPRVGGQRNVAIRNMEAQVKPILRRLCGIGLHNAKTPPGMFTACMGIAICGDRFEDRFDQEALLEMLAETQRRHARPTTAVQRQLMEAWGWSGEEITSSIRDGSEKIADIS